MPPPMLTVGSIRIIPLSDGGFAPPVGQVMPTISAEQWEPMKEYLNSDGTLPLNFGSFLISEGDTWTLVDTGFGEREGSPGGRLLGELEKARSGPTRSRGSSSPTSIPTTSAGTPSTATARPEVVFKQARHVVQRIDWEHFQQPDVKKSTSTSAWPPTRSRRPALLDLIDGDQSISQAISALHTPGHTPGHQSILIASGDEKAIITGDVTHTPAQVVHPDWCMAFDLDQRTRRADPLGRLRPHRAGGAEGRGRPLPVPQHRRLRAGRRASAAGNPSANCARGRAAARPPTGVIATPGASLLTARAVVRILTDDGPLGARRHGRDPYGSVAVTVATSQALVLIADPLADEGLALLRRECRSSRAAPIPWTL